MTTKFSGSIAARTTQTLTGMVGFGLFGVTHSGLIKMEFVEDSSSNPVLVYASTEITGAHEGRMLGTVLRITNISDASVNVTVYEE